MAFLDDLLSNARWLDQYLGTQTDKNPNLTADEAQRSPKAAQANAQSVADWLRANGLLGAGPQGTSSGLLRPNANGASGVDESGFNLAYPGPTQLPTAAAPTAQQGPIPGGPSYMGNPFGGAVQVPTAGIQPETIDVSAAPKRQLPVQPLPSTMPVGAVNPDQVLPSPAPQGPGVFGRLQAGAQNFTTGGNPIAGLLNAVQGLTTGTRTDPTGIALAQQQITANAVFKHLSHGREDGAITGCHRRPDARFATRPDERIFQATGNSGSISRKKCIRWSSRWWNTGRIGLSSRLHTN